MTLPSLLTDPLSWDQPIIAGRRWPGIARVEGCERGYEWQVNKGKGTDGATTAYQGGTLAKPKITFELWIGYYQDSWCDFFAEWEAYKTVFEMSFTGSGAKNASGGKDPVALKLEHPQATHNKIMACVVEKIGDIKLTGPCRGTVTVELLEYRKPTPKVGGTPKQSTTSKGTAPGTPERPISAAEQKARQLDAESAAIVESFK